MSQIQPFSVPQVSGAVGPQSGYPRYHGHEITNTGTTQNTVQIMTAAGTEIDRAILAAGGQSRNSVMGGITSNNGIQVVVTGTSAMEGSIYIA